MVRLAISSDNHIDINLLDPEVVISEQVAFLQHQSVNIYLIAGDLFNDFRKSQQFAQTLAAKMPEVTVKFIAGNHDMVKGISYAELETRMSPEYFHNQYLDVAGTDWRVIGNNGWYDYSFATRVNRTPAQFLAWKRAFSVDGLIKQPIPDIERMSRVLAQTKAQFTQARAAGKKILFMTHFVPSNHYVHFNDDDRFWNVYVGLLGSQRLGDQIQDFGVERVVFGHLHIKPAPTMINGTLYYNQSVGYGTHRHHEWRHATFIEEWQSRLAILDL
ncbi:phosphoesterase [Secundilactobacillus kimchicus]|uniref:metallophosphoesterase n=1 Tax=Secundilactobacillus kimchicus TaxID=528209 RepID=UPI001C031417|nr:metallophosphoesterase [Secundilactobacillus kimchicus]MBT9671049.1 phosphoesterase [Secundilactobacillus kimchicus]